MHIVLNGESTFGSETLQLMDTKGEPTELGDPFPDPLGKWHLIWVCKDDRMSAGMRKQETWGMETSI